MQPIYIGNEASKAVLKANMILDGVQLTYSTGVNDASTAIQWNASNHDDSNIYDYQNNQNSNGASAYPWFPWGDEKGTSPVEIAENYKANWIPYKVSSNPSGDIIWGTSANLDCQLHLRNMEIKGIQVQKQRKWNSDVRNDPRCNMGCKPPPDQSGLVNCGDISNHLPFYYYPCPHNKVSEYIDNLKQSLWDIDGSTNNPFMISLKNFNGDSEGRQYKLNQQIIYNISKSLDAYATSLSLDSNKIMNLSNIYNGDTVNIKVDKRPYFYHSNSSGDSYIVSS